MKVKLELDPSLTEPEIIIKAPQLTPEVNELVQSLQLKSRQLIFYQGETEYYLALERILFLRWVTEGPGPIPAPNFTRLKLV